MIPAIGPNDMAASWGRALVMAATTFSASGSISAPQAGQRLLDPLDPGPRRRPVDARRQLGDLVEPEVGEPQRLGDRGRSASEDGWCPAASWLIAPCRARSQLTGPPDQLISFWSSANSGILPSRSSGEPPAADGAEEGAEAEGITGGVAAAGLPALGITVGRPEAERQITHTSTVDA